MDDRIIYTKISNERSRKLAVSTKIYQEESGERYVVKYATYPEGIEHLNRIQAAHDDMLHRFQKYGMDPILCTPWKEGLRFAYVQGNTLEGTLNGLIDDGDFQKAKDLLVDYLETLREAYSDETFRMTPDFVRVFGNVNFTKTYRSGTVNNIDLVLDNIVLTSEKSYILDYEWTFPFPIPFEYIAYRVVHYYVYRNIKCQDLLDNGFLDVLKLDAEEQNIFKNMEENFQKYVTGKEIPIRDMNTFFDAPHVDVKEALQWRKVKVYFDYGEGIAEETSREVWTKQEGAFRELAIDVPKDVKLLRIDPVELQFCYLKILDFRDELGEVEERTYSNGVCIGDEWYFLDEPDPWFLIENPFKRVVLRYQITVIREEDRPFFEETLSRIREIRSNSQCNQDVEGLMRMSHEIENNKRKITVYFDYGEGLSQENCQSMWSTWKSDYYEISLFIPKEASAIRFDPVEQEFSIVTLLDISDDTGSLQDRLHCNGVFLDGKWYFLDEQDPWFYVEKPVGNVTMQYQITIVSQEDMELYQEERKKIRKARESFMVRLKNRIRRILHVTKYMLKYFFKHGIRGIRTAYREMDRVGYHQWFLEHRISQEMLEEQKQQEFQFQYRPKISILVPTYRTPIPVLREMIDSVCAQSYSNWELCIADGSMGDEELEQTVAEYHDSDNRVVYKKLEENKGISGNTNAALAMATGDYVGLLDHDDLLEPDALYEVVKRLQEKEFDILYTDEDKVNGDSTKYMDPNFKPDFSIDLFRSHNYITHFFVVKRALISSVGGFRSEYDGSQDYDVMFRCIENSKDICHIPKVLYHWRMIVGSTAENPESKMYCYEAGKKAIESHLERMKIPAKVEMTDMWGIYHTVYEVVGNPLVSIVIANKDLTDMLDRCIRSIQEKSTYRNFEFIIVENNSVEKKTFDYYEKIQQEFSNVHVVVWEDEFNYSSINNFGVKHANGEYIFLLNNDTEMITPTAMEEMLGICSRDDVGIVGAKLLYEDETVQHAGVVVGFGGYAGHVFHGVPRNDLGYMMRPRMNCNYSAVTAACLMVKKSIFNEVGGLTEVFKVACNDIDFCLKVREKGYLVVYNAFSEWYHYESKSRGYEDTPEKKERFRKEVEKFQKRWGDILEEGDPYYNRNFPITKAPFEL